MCHVSQTGSQKALGICRLVTVDGHLLVEVFRETREKKKPHWNDQEITSFLGQEWKLTMPVMVIVDFYPQSSGLPGCLERLVPRRSPEAADTARVAKDIGWLAESAQGKTPTQHFSLLVRARNDKSADCHPLHIFLSSFTLPSKFYTSPFSPIFL